MRSRCLSILAFCVLVAPDLRAQTPPRACDQFHAAVRADSNNLDAAASLGACSVRDYEMIAPGGDSTRMVFRSSWSNALRALRHAVEVDPRYSRAYRPLFAILFAESRDGCSSVTGECGYVSPVVRDGDSVITILRRVRLNVPGVDTYGDVVRESQANRRTSLTEARRVAERWASVAPNDPRPRNTTAGRYWHSENTLPLLLNWSSRRCWARPTVEEHCSGTGSKHSSSPTGRRRATRARRGRERSRT